jgi:ABC-type dipeptide/oligopeptide/nickel transport system permease subunit
MTSQEQAAKNLAKGTQALGVSQQKVTNLWVDAASRLLRNRAAVLGLVVILLLILMAIFADHVAPYHYAAGDSNENYAIPPWAIWRLMPKWITSSSSAPTIWGATC